jgi:hypothetical protein
MKHEISRLWQRIPFFVQRHKFGGGCTGSGRQLGKHASHATIWNKHIAVCANARVDWHANAHATVLVHSTNKYSTWIISKRIPIRYFVPFEEPRNLSKAIKKEAHNTCNIYGLTPSTVDNKLSSSAKEAKTSFSAISASLKGLLPTTGATLLLTAEVSSFL